jgi:hypothetical protein
MPKAEGLKNERVAIRSSTHSGVHRKQERAAYIPSAIQLFL